MKKIVKAIVFVFLLSSVSFFLPPVAFASSTINATNQFAYGANVGWMDWRGDTNSGAVIGEYVCSGTSSGNGYGLYATTANNCSGTSASSYGLIAYAVATGCSGTSSSGIGLSAFIASVCLGQTTSGTALSTTHNVNSF